MNRIMRISAALCVGLIVLAFAGAGNAADAPAGGEWKAPARASKKKNPVASDAASIAAGKAAYTKECLSCHGETGKGDGPAAKDLQVKPGDLANPKLWEQSDGALFWKLTEGKTPMPSVEKLLSEDQRWQVINFVRTFSPKPAGVEPK